MLRGLQGQLAHANGSMEEYRRLLMKDAWATMDSLKHAFGATMIRDWDDAQKAIHACETLLDLKNDPAAAPVHYYRDAFGARQVTNPSP